MGSLIPLALMYIIIDADPNNYWFWICIILKATTEKIWRTRERWWSNINYRCLANRSKPFYEFARLPQLIICQHWRHDLCCGHILFLLRTSLSPIPTISSMRLMRSTECILTSRLISFSLRSDLMDYDSDECRLSILRRDRILSSNDLVRENAPLSLSFFLEVAFLRSLMEILLPKYSLLGLSYCLDLSLNYRLAVLS